MKIDFLNLRQQYLELKNEIDKAVIRALDSGWYILGDECKKFEKEFKGYLVGSKEGYLVSVNSGTDALVISLLAIGVKPGDEVITVANTAIPTVAAICSIGAIPVFCDVDEDTWLIDVNKIEKCITAKTKALIPVHLYGASADMNTIINIANKFNIKVIEDVAQATGTLYEGYRVGTIGDIGAFSFYPSKNLGAMGDGGAIFVKNKEDFNNIKKMRNYGQSSKYVADIENGINSRLDELQAAILSVKIPYIDVWNDKKRELAMLYKELIDENSIPIKYQKCKMNSKHSYHLFAIKVKEGTRDKLLSYLKQRGIECLIHYPICLYKQEAFKKYFRNKNAVSEDLCNNIISLPLHPYLEKNQVEYIIESINNFYTVERQSV